MKYICSYKELKKYDSFRKKIKDFFKHNFIKIVSKNNFNIDKGNIVFPFYHHVFDDEIENFNKQIKYMKNHGDFISYDQALILMESGINKNEIYFCMSFDDGFKNIIENISDILLTYSIPATFFIPTSFIGNKREDAGKIFFNDENISINFLDWEDCQKIADQKLFSIGSHSVNHPLISKLNEDDSKNEMKISKKEIEIKLSVPCNHFAPPVGDFSFIRDIKIAQQIGYKSLSTTLRGKMNKQNNNVYHIYRHHLIAGWGTNYLKFFFNK